MEKEKILNFIKLEIGESIKVINELEKNCIEVISKSALVIIDSLKNGGKILICGNGGSAADSQHFAAELVGRFKKDRKPLPAIALTTDTSILTAWSNDYSFDTVFSRQIQALGNKNDVLFAITTSGNSKNIIEAVKIAKEMGIFTISLTGNNGGRIKEIADISIIVPSSDTARIQQAHSVIIHILCNIIENEFFK
jgi:D-sedoheptulose 7-phosphate isomerase